MELCLQCVSVPVKELLFLCRIGKAERLEANAID